MWQQGTELVVTVPVSNGGPVQDGGRDHAASRCQQLRERHGDFGGKIIG